MAEYEAVLQARIRQLEEQAASVSKALVVLHKYGHLFALRLSDGCKCETCEAKRIILAAMPAPTDSKESQTGSQT